MATGAGSATTNQLCRSGKLLDSCVIDFFICKMDMSLSITGWVKHLNENKALSTSAVSES
jgi:hypothetical protein